MLTKSLIDHLPPKATRYVEWDRELPGFGLRVMPTGRKSFIVSYRLPGARQAITATIGTFGVITLHQARTKAREILATARLGGDPQAERKARAAAEIARAKLLTVEGLVQQYSAALRVGTVRTSRSRGLPGSVYIADTARHLERFADRYGKRAAAGIVRSDVVALLDEFIDQPSAHRRMHGAIDRMYSWARQAELVVNDPAADIVVRSSPARERVLTLQELAAIWHAAEQLDQPYQDLIRLMILTAQRKTEVAGMTWSEIDLPVAIWTLPTGRTKARRQHIVPLPATAVAILQARQQESADGLVLPVFSRSGKTPVPVSGWDAIKQSLDRRLTLPPWRMHDFRRSLVTIMAEQGADVAVLDSLLNHASSATRGGVIGVYQRATLTGPIRALMGQWDALLNVAITSCSRTRTINPPACC